MTPSDNLENKTLSDTYWIVQLVPMKVHAHSSFRTTAGIKWELDDFGESRLTITFLTILGVI